MMEAAGDTEQALATDSKESSTQRAAAAATATRCTHTSEDRPLSPPVRETRKHKREFCCSEEADTESEEKETPKLLEGRPLKTATTQQQEKKEEAPVFYLRKKRRRQRLDPSAAVLARMLFYANSSAAAATAAAATAAAACCLSSEPLPAVKSRQTPQLAETPQQTKTQQLIKTPQLTKTQQSIKTQQLTDTPQLTKTPQVLDTPEPCLPPLSKPSGNKNQTGPEGAPNPHKQP